MHVNLDGKYAFRVNADSTVTGFRNDKHIAIDNFGFAAAHQICALIKRIEELEGQKQSRRANSR